MSDTEPCPRIEALSALVDDALPEPERRALQAHVAGCTVCAPVLAGFVQLHDRMRAARTAAPMDAPAFDLAPEIDRLIGAAAPRPAAPVPKPPRRRWWPAAVLAPGGAIALAGGFWLGTVLTPSTLGTARAPSVQMAAFATLPPGALCPLADACGGPAR